MEAFDRTVSAGYQGPMPIVTASDYRPPFVLWNGHVQTVYPPLFRPMPSVRPVRERLFTPDEDFLDIDWHRAEGRRPPRLAVISHGLEGNARRKYVAGMARALTRAGWDVLAWNFRGCSGEPNRLLRYYHSGDTDDLHTVLTHGLARRGYDTAALVGFSIGGNQVLKYLGEDPDRVPKAVKAAVAFSVPCDLAGGAQVLARPANRLYMEYFLRSLRAKARLKGRLFEGALDLTGLEAMRTFDVFDERFTAPLHGFAGAADYYARASSLPHLPAIRVPTLLVNALDDPFLSAACTPRAAAAGSRQLFLEMPISGGHVGFVERNRDNVYWSERRAAAFLDAAV